MRRIYTVLGSVAGGQAASSVLVSIPSSEKLLHYSSKYAVNMHRPYYQIMPIIITFTLFIIPALHTIFTVYTASTISTISRPYKISIVNRLSTILIPAIL